MKSARAFWVNLIHSCRVKYVGKVFSRIKVASAITNASILVKLTVLTAIVSQYKADKG